MSAPSRCGQRAARRRIIGGDDRMQSLQLQRGDDRKPDRTAADHQRHLVAAHIGLVDRVDADRERFGERRVFRREPVGHFEQQRLAEQHALGIAADIVVGIADARPDPPASAAPAANRRASRASACAASPGRNRGPRSRIRGRTRRRGRGPSACGRENASIVRPCDGRACARAGRNRRCRRRAS